MKKIFILVISSIFVSGCIHITLKDCQIEDTQVTIYGTDQVTTETTAQGIPIK